MPTLNGTQPRREYSGDWPAEHNPAGNIPGIGQWNTTTRGIFQGLANGTQLRGEYFREWPMERNRAGNILGIGQRNVTARGIFQELGNGTHLPAGGDVNRHDGGGVGRRLEGLQGGGGGDDQRGFTQTTHELTQEQGYAKLVSSPFWNDHSGRSI